MSNTALLVIDMLNDFILEDAPLRVPGGKEIIPSIAAQIERARQAGMPVIYLCDCHTEDDPELHVWPRHAIKDTPGAQVVAELAPIPSDIVIPKTRYSGFFRTDLEQRLGSLRIERVILTGVCTEICILYTAVDAMMRGLRVDVPDGCTAGLSEEGHRFALHQIRNVLQPGRE
jgi:nicotinamidase-related amidase